MAVKISLAAGKLAPKNYNPKKTAEVSPERIKKVRAEHAPPLLKTDDCLLSTDSRNLRAASNIKSNLLPL